MVLVNNSDMDKARLVLRDHQRDTMTHRVSVCETKPVEGGPGGLGVGFEAVCECDWTGSIRESSSDAFEDARAHSKNVAPDIVYTRNS